MTDSPRTEPDIEDREANIRLTVQHIISTKLDEMYEQFDRLHRRNISDDDVIEALRYFGDIELLDGYAEWADIDIREDDNTTLDPTVPDPAGASSYAGHPLAQSPEVKETGHVNIGATTIEVGRDELGGQWIRPEGGFWVGIVENLG